MKLAREYEGLKFVAECDDLGIFTFRRIECAGCGRSFDRGRSSTISFICSGCGSGKAFWSEGEMKVAEKWNPLREDRFRSMP
jgi:hypothetical protein